MDELVEAWLLAMESLGEMFASLSDPLKATGAIAKMQEVTSGMARFSELDALTAEDSAYIHEKYGGRIAEASKEFTDSLADAQSSPFGSAIAGALSDFHTIGK